MMYSDINYFNTAHIYTNWRIFQKLDFSLHGLDIAINASSLNTISLNELSKLPFAFVFFFL